MIARGTARRRGAAGALLIVLVAAFAGCGGRKGIRGTPESDAGEVGVYRARSTDPAGKTRRFKLLLWAGEPDRVHGEIVSPVGTTVVIFDGGASRLSVDLVRDRVAFSGAGDARALGQIFGVGLSLEGLVGQLLGRRSDAAPQQRVEREGAVGRLPDRLVIEDAATGRLQLVLRERRRLPATADVGHGRPTAGFEVRALESFPRDALPSDEEVDP